MQGGTGVAVCAGDFCLSPYTGTGAACDGTEGAGVSDGCSVSPEGTVVCDCLASPEICQDELNPNCQTVDGVTECWSEDDLNNPINNFNFFDDPTLPPSQDNPDETPDLLPTPTPPSPSPTPPAPNVPDGDPNAAATQESEADNAQGIINAINVNTQAVDNVATTVFNAGNQVTTAVDNARIQIFDAVDNNALANKENLTTETDRLIAQANSDRTANFNKDFDNTKKITDAIVKNCNPLSDPNCAVEGSASAADNCAAPSVCTSPDPAACAQLVQSWNVMCAVMELADQEAEPNTDTGTVTGDCSAPPVCTSADPLDCVAIQQTWESACALVDTQGELAPWEIGGDPDYNRDLADEATSIDVQGGQDQSGFASGTCPSDIPVNTDWASFNIDMSFLCIYASWVRVFVILVTLMWSGAYIVRSF